MKPMLRGIEAKLARADKHLDTLNTKVREFIESETPTIVGEYEPQSSCYSFKISLRQQPAPIIGVVLGDVVHNLRSALDHLAWQLVSQSRHPPGIWTSFPLYDRPKTFREKVEIPGRK